MPKDKIYLGDIKDKSKIVKKGFCYYYENKLVYWLGKDTPPKL